MIKINEKTLFFSSIILPPAECRDDKILPQLIVNKSERGVKNME